MRARVALLTVSTVIGLGGVLAACGSGGQQADCAAAAGDLERFVSCVPVERHDDEPEPPEPPAIPFEAADEVAVGTRIVVGEEDAELVVLDGPAGTFRETSTPGIYVASVAGTYQVVPYVRVPCGGPPDESDARTITIVADGDGHEADGSAPPGLLRAGRPSSPSC